MYIHIREDSIHVLDRSAQMGPYDEMHSLSIYFSDNVVHLGHLLSFDLNDKIDELLEKESQHY